VPKIAQLVEARLHAWFDERCVEPRFQQIVLPSLWPRKRNTRGGETEAGLDGDDGKEKDEGGDDAGGTAGLHTQDLGGGERQRHWRSDTDVDADVGTRDDDVGQDVERRDMLDPSDSISNRAGTRTPDLVDGSVEARMADEGQRMRESEGRGRGGGGGGGAGGDRERMRDAEGSGVRWRAKAGPPPPLSRSRETSGDGARMPGAMP